MKKFLAVLLVCISLISLIAGCGEVVEGTPGATVLPTIKPTPTPSPTPYRDPMPIPSPSKISIQESGEGWRYAMEKNQLIIYGYTGDLKSLTIPETMSIGGSEFPVRVLDRLAICDDTRVYVGDTRFVCKIEELVIPDTIDVIPDGFFERCDNLRSVSWKGFKIVNGVVFSKDMKTLYYCLDKDITSYKIPSSVEVIDGGAFRSCTKLTSIEIPSTVKVINDYAFYNCASLKTVDIKEGVEVIGDQVFTRGVNIESITIPESVHAIGYYTLTCSPKLNIYLKKGCYVDQFFISIADDGNMWGVSATYAEYVTYVD